MGRFIHGVISATSYDPTGMPGEYTFTNAVYSNVADVEGLGTSALATGFLIYIPAVDNVNFYPIPGVAHRYKITALTIEDSSHISGTIIWNEEGAELDYPGVGVDAIISQTSVNNIFGFPVSEMVYPTLAGGTSLAALNLDTSIITDNLAGSGLILGPAPDGSYLNGAVPLTEDQKISDAIDQINSIMGFLVPTAPPSLDTITPTVSLTSYTAKLSANAPVPGPYAAGETLPRVTKTPTPVLTYTGFGSADKGLIHSRINSTNFVSFNLETAFVEANRNGNQGDGYAGSALPYSPSSSRLQITSVGRYASFGAFQTGTVIYSPLSTDAALGYNTYELIHTVSGDKVSPTYVLYYDSSTLPTAGALSGSIQTSSLKYLSGIPAYGAGSSMSFSMAAATAPFANTYMTTGVWATLAGSAVSSTNIVLTDASAVGVSNPPAIADTPSISSKVLSFNSSQTTDSPAWSAIIVSPRGNSSAASHSKSSFYINTYGNDSTAIQDTFVDELYRIPADGIYDSVSSVTSATWDSSAALATSELMLFLGSLRYSNKNFTTYAPVGPDYSGRSGTQAYARKFTLASTTNAVLYLTPNSLPSGVNIRVKLPGLTGWINPLSPYLGGTPTNDGDGCLVGSTSVVSTEIKIPMTFGTNSTVNSGGLVLVKLYWDTTVSPTFNVTKLRIALS